MNDELQARIADLEAERDRLAESLKALLTNISEFMTQCRRCRTDIAFVRHRNGKLAPYEMDGRNHFITCPAAVLKGQDDRRKES